MVPFFSFFIHQTSMSVKAKICAPQSVESVSTNKENTVASVE